ncbi:hypothetical protein BJX68DRAFT_270128 [Aspergillus pseudodeflectus]|uniref:BHLH domain-containing protein n=1 Tax=Aspergillus pseudodeflectus TaxID=176178 RepID=A0ABR4JTN4_9EURO
MNPLESPAGDVGAFGYVILNNHLGHHPPQLWPGNEPREVAVRKINCDCKPELDGFSFNGNSGYQQYSETPTVPQPPLTDRPFDGFSYSQETNPVGGSTPITATGSDVTPTAGEFQSRVTIFDARGPNRPTQGAEVKLQHLHWGSDLRFTQVGYAPTPDQVSEEDVTKRLLQNSPFLISHSRASVSRQAGNVLAGIGVEMAQPPGMVSTGGARSDDDNNAQSGGSTGSLNRKTGLMGQPGHSRKLREKLRRDLMGKAYEELQDLVPGLRQQAPTQSQILNEAYSWIQELIDDIGVLRAQFDEMEAREAM